MMKDNLSEMFPVVDERGDVIGCSSRRRCHDGHSRLLHPVVHLHLFNTEGALFLQRRPAWKDIQPGKWDTAVGGHVAWGETIEEALRREAHEELGITDFQPEKVESYRFDSDRECEMVHIFRTRYDGPVTPSSELDGGRFWSCDEIAARYGTGVFTPNFEAEIRRFARELFAWPR